MDENELIQGISDILKEYTPQLKRAMCDERIRWDNRSWLEKLDSGDFKQGEAFLNTLTSLLYFGSLARDCGARDPAALIRKISDRILELQKRYKEDNPDAVPDGYDKEAIHNNCGPEDRKNHFVAKLIEAHIAYPRTPEHVHWMVAKLLEPHRERFLTDLKELEEADPDISASVTAFRGPLKDLDGFWDKGNILTYLKNFHDVLPEGHESKPICREILGEIAKVVGEFYKVNFVKYDTRLMLKHARDNVSRKIPDRSMDWALQVARFSLPFDRADSR